MCIPPKRRPKNWEAKRGRSVVACKNEYRLRFTVERSFAWLEKCRRLWKNCERKLSTSLQMMLLAFIGLLLKRF